MAGVKVLLAGQDPSFPGGMSNFVRVLTDYLASHGDVDLQHFNETKVKGRSGMSSASKKAALRESLIALPEFNRELKRIRPDVVHLNAASGTSLIEKSLMAVMARRRGVPAALHVHGSSFDVELQNIKPLRRRVLAAALGTPNYAIVLTGIIERLLKTAIPQARIVVIPTSVDLIASPPDIGPRPICIGFIGFMNGRKGEESLVQAMARSQDKSYRMVLAGDGPNRQAAEQQARTLGVADRIDFSGVIKGEEKDRFFRGIHALALPSLAENMPASLLESMAYARPVIATPVGGVREMIHEERNGWLVQPGDVDGLSSILDRVVQDREEITRRGKQAWDIVAANYTWQINGPRYVRLYQQLASASR